MQKKSKDADDGDNTGQTAVAPAPDPAAEAAEAAAANPAAANPAAGAEPQPSVDVASPSGSKAAKLVKQKRVLHIVPHSHTDDIQSNKDLQKTLSESEDPSTSELYDKGTPSGYIGSVSDILDSTMQELYSDGNRTFTFGDLKFFKQWYDKLNETEKSDVKTVVANG